MDKAEDFAQLIRRVRAGDPHAATELVERYEKVLMRTITTRLRNSGLQAHFGFSDIRQSVFGSLFVRLRLGQYEVNSSSDLVNLLLRMAHNKVTAKERWARPRPDTRPTGGGGEGPPLPDPEPPPSEIVSIQELLAKAQALMTDEERQILARRDEGQEWTTLAAEMGGTAEGRRKQWERARARVAAELGLED